MNIAVVGTGYVGLVTAACLADFGNKVYGIDKDEKKLSQLQSGKAPFYEPGLDELLDKNIAAGMISFHKELTEIDQPLDVIFICVGTYPLPDGQPDLSHIEQAVKEISQYLTSDNFTVVVQKSTAPPGTVGWITEIMAQGLPLESFAVVSNPEFLKESTAIEDTLYPDRIVVGSQDQKAFSVMGELYRPIVERSNCMVLEIKPVEAELVKYAANAFLATKISFANAVAILCDKLGADIRNVVDGFGSDRRIGKSFLGAGIGYGGSCFPKDVKGMIDISKKQGYNFDLLKDTEAINSFMRDYFIGKIIGEFGSLKGRQVGVCGLSFKPGTDDLRESPALVIIQKLIEMGAIIKAHDPVVVKIPYDVEMVDNPYDAADGSEALLFLTDWNEYRKLDFEKMRELLQKPLIFDGRNMLDNKKMAALGYKYFDIGGPGL